jgi:mono/diheme cytochrome c family protein
LFRHGLMLLASALAAAVGPTQALAADRSQTARGGYLVKAFGCADCHTPLKMGPNGPQPDLSRSLSGHPQALALPPAPAAQGPWLWGGAATNTAFWGPWGVSYAANLTPDAETGLGRWKPADFVAAMRKGQHLGVSRPLLPPMPWQAIGQLDDRDLKAMFAYLLSQPAVPNAVPAPLPAIAAKP